MILPWHGASKCCFKIRKSEVVTTFRKRSTLHHGLECFQVILITYVCSDLQMHSVDVSMLAENCPHLEELGAKLEGGWYGEEGTMLPHLITCRIRVGATETLHALLVHATRLEHLEVRCLVMSLHYRDSIVNNCTSHLNKK